MYVMLLIWKIRLAVFLLALLKYTCLLSDNIYFIFISMRLRGTVNVHFVRMASKGLIKFSCLCSSYTEAAGSNAAFNVSANVGCTFNKVGEYRGGGRSLLLPWKNDFHWPRSLHPSSPPCLWSRDTERVSTHSSNNMDCSSLIIMVRFHLVCST